MEMELISWQDTLPQSLSTGLDPEHSSGSKVDTLS